MYESISTVGERGQITIPKSIREKEGIKEKDKLIIKIEDNKIIIEKFMSKEKKEELMKEYYIKYAEAHKKINNEWEVLEKETNWFLK